MGAPIDADTDGNTESGDAIAHTVLADVASLVNDKRDTHGDAVANQEHIADAWEWYLRGNGVLAADATITGADVSRMMALLKMSRSAVGEHDIDHDRDVAGYAGIASACEFLNGDVTADELTVADD
jgi:hypothetical protein